MQCNNLLPLSTLDYSLIPRLSFLSCMWDLCMTYVVCIKISVSHVQKQGKERDQEPLAKEMYLLQLCVLRMMMWNDRIIGDVVVCNEEGPASPVAVVLVTSMKDVGVEKESISGLHLYFNQWKHLQFV